MVCFFPVRFSPVTRSIPVVILASAWVCGLLAGTYIAFSADISFLSLMRPVLSEPVSIVSLLISQLLPVFLSAFAVMISVQWLLFILAFGEAFLLTYVVMGVMLSFGSPGWLPALLLLLSGGFGCCVNLWFWISALRFPVSGVHRRLILTAAAVFLISLLNDRYLHPFMTDLFNI